jgi:hypothetical protein
MSSKLSVCCLLAANYTWDNPFQTTSKARTDCFRVTLSIDRAVLITEEILELFLGDRKSRLDS